MATEEEHDDFLNRDVASKRVSSTYIEDHSPPSPSSSSDLIYEGHSQGCHPINFKSEFF